MMAVHNHVSAVTMMMSVEHCSRPNTRKYRQLGSFPVEISSEIKSLKCSDVWLLPY